MHHLHLEAVAPIHQRDSWNIRSGQINSLVHSEKKDWTGELSNIKRPGRPRMTTVVDDRRILSMVKKNPFTTSSQEKNTLQEADVSTIKRRLHQSKYRGFTTSCKQGQKPELFWKSILWTAEIKIQTSRRTGRKKSGEGLEQLMIQSIQHHLWNMEQCDHELHGFSGSGLLVFSDDETEDRSSRINSAVYRDILSAQIQSNAAKLIGRRFIERCPWVPY